MWYQPSLLSNNNTHQQQYHTWENILRHECAYKDRLKKFGWTKHDGKTFGAQQIVDPTNHVELAVQWIQLNQSIDRWALRIQGNAYSDTNSNDRYSSKVGNDLSLFVYLATPENFTATVTQQNNVFGRHTDASSYRLWLDPAVNNTHPTYWNAQTHEAVAYNATSYFYATQVDPAYFYNPKPNIIAELRDPTSSLPPHLFDPTASLYRAETARTGNQIVLQVFYRVPFSVDVHFSYVHNDPSTPPGIKAPISNGPSITMITHPSNTSSDKTVTDALLRASTEWERRFENTFLKATAPWSENERKAAQFALGNMLGSLTYMYGDQQLLVDNQVVSLTPAELSAIVPDRPDHAQGFFWDEGFHQHLVSLWDMDLSHTIVKSWFSQIDEEGWIARQQMLGNEIRWGARPSSWPQIPGTANPPSLHLFLETLLRRHEELGTHQACPEPGSSFFKFLDEIWDPLERNIRWYLRTQKSSLGVNLFRWTGRTKAYCLPSGMDDYPRAPILTIHEAHLDLQVWMVMSTRLASKIATCLGKNREATQFHARSTSIKNALLENFWDERRGLFDEFYFGDADTTRDSVKTWSGHLGYLNFWPLFLYAIDTESIQFERSMKQLLDERNGMWTGFGLRSLSPNDTYYQMGDNYWTGPIWMNINFLIVASLHQYIMHPDRYPMKPQLRAAISTSYTELRKGLISTVVDSYAETGFIWEVYSGDNGNGFNNHPFTGWSALIVNVMSEMY